LERRILPGERVLVDASVLIAYFEPQEQSHAAAEALVDDYIQSGRNPAVLSPVTAMELLVRPLRHAPKGARHVHDFLTLTPSLTLLGTDLYVAHDAASLIALHNFKPADALVIATGLVAQVAHLVTNDAEWRRKLAPMKRRVQVTELRDYL
jgi:predicted nucleic acid-binding protein